MYQHRKTITALLTMASISACIESGDDLDTIEALEAFDPNAIEVLELEAGDPVPERPFDEVPMTLTLEPGVSAITGLDVANALGVPGATIDWGTSDLQGLDALSDTASDLPTEGADYLAISSGCVSAAFTPNTSGSTSCQLSGLNTNAGQDLVQVSVTIPVPDGYTCWIVDWKFFSEEYPEYVGTAFNDAFLIEVNQHEIRIGTRLK